MDNMMKFIEYQHQRAIIGEISENTIANYYKAAKLFCENAYCYTEGEISANSFQPSCWCM
jgi:hypothetical protein